MNYYNEFDPFAAEWLRELIKAGLIPNGEVDIRSIVDVSPDDLRHFTQCHFFAGIGGWSRALAIAGWPDDRPIWTGSCPCQPFSVAGKGKGKDDERHLWPVFHRLIAECRPPVVMGEQVSGKAGYGWFDGVAADLQREGYASRAVDIPACAVDAPHIRQRLYWVAVDDAMRGRHGDADQEIFAGRNGSVDASRFNSPVGNADAMRELQSQGAICDERGWIGAAGGCDMENASDNGTGCVSGKIIDGRRGTLDAGTESIRRTNGESLSGGADARNNSGKSFWDDTEWLTGADGKTRRSKPGVRLLVNGVPNRVGRLRGYGNAIVPPLAAEVIKAFMDTE